MREWYIGQWGSNMSPFVLQFRLGDPFLAPKGATVAKRPPEQVGQVMLNMTDIKQDEATDPIGQQIWLNVPTKLYLCLLNIQSFSGANQTTFYL